MSIVGLTKLRKPFLLAGPTVSVPRGFHLRNFSTTKSLRSNQSDTGVSTSKVVESANPQVNQQAQFSVMTERLRSLEESLLLHCEPLVEENKFLYPTRNEEGPYSKQKNIEVKSVDKAVDRYRSVYEDVIKIGKGATLGAAHRYMMQWFSPLAKAVESEQTRLSQAVVATINSIDSDVETELEANENDTEATNGELGNEYLLDEKSELETDSSLQEPIMAGNINVDANPSASLEGEDIPTTENAEDIPPPPSTPPMDISELPSYLHQLLSLTPQKLAVITMHTCLGLLLQAPGGVPFNRAAMHVGNAVQAEYVLERVKLQDKKFYKMLKAKLGGKLSVHKLNKHARTWIEEKWDNKTVAQLGGALITHLMDAAIISDPVKREIRVFEKTARIGKQDAQLKMHQFMVKEVLKDPELLKEIVPALYLPMVVPPKPWSAPVRGGYMTLKTCLMRIKDFRTQMAPVTQIWKETDVLDPVFKGLNCLAKTPWKINKDLYEVVRTAWENGGDIADLPSRVDKPVPPISPEYSQREWWRLLKKIAQHNANLHSLRCDLMLKMTVARDFQDEKLYFPHNVDFRGRAYPIPPHLNHMGPDLCRALLLFYEGKPLGPRGLYWLKIHLANLYGKDKSPFEERVQFVDNEMDNIMDAAKNPLTGRKWWLNADYPWQTLAACFEMKRALESKDPEKYVCHLPIHQDGTCNGLQHYAALGGDVMGAQQVNLLPSDRPQDVYAGVAKLVSKRIDEDAAAGNKLAQQLIGKINRKIVKQTVMTSVYGVTYIGARAQIANAIKDQPNMQEFYMDESKLFLTSSYITKHTFASLKEMFLGARLIMDWLNQCARVIAKTNMPVMWISPIGVPVVQPYRKEYGSRDFVQTVVQTMRLRDSHELPINVTRQRSAFPPNFVHSVDSSHMMYTALECERRNIVYASVHDSYWTHAATVDDMNVILRREFINLHKQPLLEKLLESFRKNYPTISEYPPLPKRGELDLDQVANSRYFFN